MNCLGKRYYQDNNNWLLLPVECLNLKVDCPTSCVTALQRAAYQHYLQLRDPTGQETLFWDWVGHRRVVMILANSPEGIVYEWEKPLAPGGGVPRCTLQDFPTGWDRSHCRCPLGRCRGPQPQIRGFPTPDPVLKSVCCCLFSSVMGMLWPRHPALVFVFQTCHWLFIVVTDPLITSLLSLRFILGVIQCLATQVF